MTKPIQLSKSKFMNGIQCLKSLYLTCYHPELKEPATAYDSYIMDTGSKIGVLARNLFPKGLLIEQDHNEYDEAVTATQKALVNDEIEHIFEAALSFDDIKIRIDILKKNKGGSFEIIEVKSSTKVKPAYLSDIAIQLYVMRGLGFKIEACKLMYVNSSYIYQGGHYNLKELFTVDDLTKEVDEVLGKVPEQLKRFRSILSQDAIPKVEVGSHCKNPNTCAFNAYCRKDFAKDNITKLYRVNDKMLKQLRDQNIDFIKDIPDEFKLSETQQRIRQTLIHGKPFVANEVKVILGELKFPLYFMDFETSNPALPVFRQTSPWKQVPFQWSVHTLNEHGKLSHSEFLPDHGNDPRLEFATSLIKVLGQTGSVIVYFENFEKGIIDGLAKHLGGDLSDKLKEINERVFDLYQLVFDHVCHPEFNGSFSIKKVLPALVPELSYEGMNIADGAAALIAYQKVLGSEVSKDEKAQIRKDLLAYCKLDTLAMVEIYKVLKGYFSKNSVDAQGS